MINIERFCKIACLFSFLFFADEILAHERWILSPNQIDFWNAKAKPDLFTKLSTQNLVMVSVFLMFIVGWVRLGFTGARELFPDLQARLASYGDHVPRILRFCLGWILLSSAFGAEPRFGVEPFTSPTLFAPDLELQSLGSAWGWLRWAEIILGLTILFGIYVRFFASLLILLSFLAGWLYGEAILAYAGALIGASIYLVLQGPGRHYLPLPTPQFLRPLQSWLADQPRQRAQAIMRILTGTTMLYLGVFFKVLQPNLALGIITLYKVPILSAAPETFTLLMALVEVSAGILIIAGILLRPLSLFLISAFSIFALLLPETVTEHILFYGVILSCLINSAGHLRRPVPTDKPAHIVIVGGGLAALHAAIKLEKIIGQYSNIKVSLLHDQSNFLFFPLLPEVIAGTVQPGNVVNPLRRIIQHVDVIVGQMESIDEKNRSVIAHRKNGDKIELYYDDLIWAPVAQSNRSDIQGLKSHAYPIDSVGDALRIRQRVLDLVEEAEFSQAQKAQPLNFAVMGSGECACTVAVEVCQMLHSAESSYPGLKKSGWQVHLYQDPKTSGSDFENQIDAMLSLCLEKAGVIRHKQRVIAKINQKEILFDDAQSQTVGMVIDACLCLPSLNFMQSGPIHRPFEIEKDLSLKDHENIWIAEAAPSRFLFGKYLEALGSAAAYNAWANSQGFMPQQFQSQKRLIKPYNLERHSLCYLGAFAFTGVPAWIVCRAINLLSVPGLEKNLRILIDWLLVIPFRSDIAVLAQAPSTRLQRSQFKKDETVYKQGDLAEIAYAVESGQLEIIQDGIKVKTLGPGDYFGEIMPIHQGHRIETVRCLSDCELTLVAQDDLKALTQGGGLMGKAIRNLSEYRSDQSLSGMKRITYVSKMSAPLNEADIIELGRISSINNRKIDVTGILISVHDYFFQIIEGEQKTLDALLDKISKDKRHADLTILRAELDCESRIFSDWDMKTIDLSESKSLMQQAINIMLQNIAQSHYTLGRYTQPVVLKLLTEGINPLTLPAQKNDKIVLSASLADLSRLSEQFEPEALVKAINDAMEAVTCSVIEHGGQAAKYSGDGMIAHFPADKADAAIAACLDAFKKYPSSANKIVIKSNFGLSSGKLIEGNIGSSIKMDYTIIGSPVDQAVRLSLLARQNHKRLFISESVHKIADPAWRFQEATKLNQPGEPGPVYMLE